MAAPTPTLPHRGQEHDGCFGTHTQGRTLSAASAQPPATPTHLPECRAQLLHGQRHQVGSKQRLGCQAGLQARRQLSAGDAVGVAWWWREGDWKVAGKHLKQLLRTLLQTFSSRGGRGRSASGRRWVTDGRRSTAAGACKACGAGCTSKPASQPARRHPRTSSRSWQREVWGCWRYSARRACTASKLSSRQRGSFSPSTAAQQRQGGRGRGRGRGSGQWRRRAAHSSQQAGEQGEWWGAGTAGSASQAAARSLNEWTLLHHSTFEYPAAHTAARPLLSTHPPTHPPELMR
jgi:hypothetical protein